jgi:diketogulonate reductase-like aldo/keto reductase
VPQTAEIEETVGAMAELVAEGLGAMRELGVGLVPYSPLGRGFLTGTVDLAALDAKDFRSRNPRFTGAAAQANQAIADAVREVADATGITPAQVALAWSTPSRSGSACRWPPSRAPSGSSGSSRTSPPSTSP